MRIADVVKVLETLALIKKYGEKELIRILETLALIARDGERGYYHPTLYALLRGKQLMTYPLTSADLLKDFPGFKERELELKPLNEYNFQESDIEQALKNIKNLNG